MLFASGCPNSASRKRHGERQIFTMQSTVVPPKNTTGLDTGIQSQPNKVSEEPGVPWFKQWNYYMLYTERPEDTENTVQSGATQWNVTTTQHF